MVSPTQESAKREVYGCIRATLNRYGHKIVCEKIDSLVKTLNAPTISHRLLIDIKSVVESYLSVARNCQHLFHCHFFNINRFAHRDTFMSAF